MTLRWNRVFKYSSCVRCVLRQEWGIQFFDTCSINNARHLLSAICSRDLHVNVSRWLIDNYMEVSRTSFRARLWFFGRWLVRSEDVSFRSGTNMSEWSLLGGNEPIRFKSRFTLSRIIPFGEQICQTASPGVSMFFLSLQSDSRISVRSIRKSLKIRRCLNRNAN